MKNSGIAKLLIGLAFVFALFQWLAASLESLRGEYGVVVGFVVVTATILWQRLFFDRSVLDAARSVGLFAPKANGVVVAIAISLVMMLALPIYAYATTTKFSPLPNWPWLFVGMFFQAGIAEETLFRGYLFGYFRRQNTFWRAASLSAIPFVVIHFLIFFTLDWMVAAASIALAVVVSFPLARLFDLGGQTMWPPAILHFTVQAGVKLFNIEGEFAAVFPLVWILVCAIVPFLVFMCSSPGTVKPESARC